MIAIIPARGGSKGLPGKNSKLLNGKPLIAYTIEEAHKAVSISEVIVSTDDHTIASIAAEYGAHVPFMRPTELATDTSLAIDVYCYTINRLEKERKMRIDAVAVLLPTCPLRNSTDIDQAVRLFNDKNADSVVSYVEEDHPIFWHRKIDSDLRICNFFDDTSLKNRQEYQRTYYPNGAIYLFRKDVLEKGLYYTENSFAYIMPRERSIDIDTQFDFDLAEFYKTKYAS
jgi:CMP-N,N'-diacetyllegionaminic acid synthase